MAIALSQTTHAVNHTVTVAATTLYQTLTHTALPRTKTATITTSLKASPTVTPALPDPISQIIASWPECVVSPLSGLWQTCRMIYWYDSNPQHLEASPQVDAVRILVAYVGMGHFR